MKVDFAKIVLGIVGILGSYLIFFLPSHDPTVTEPSWQTKLLVPTVFWLLSLTAYLFFRRRENSQMSELHDQWSVEALESDQARLAELRGRYRSLALTRNALWSSDGGEAPELFELMGLMKGEGLELMGQGYEHEELAKKGEALAGLLGVPFEDKSHGW